MRALDAGTRNKLFEVGPGVIAGSNFQAFTSDGKVAADDRVWGPGCAAMDRRACCKGKTKSGQRDQCPMWPQMEETVVFARSPTLCIPPLCPNLSTDKASLLKVAFNAVDGTVWDSFRSGESRAVKTTTIRRSPDGNTSCSTAQAAIPMMRWMPK